MKKINQIQGEQQKKKKLTRDGFAVSENISYRYGLNSTFKPGFLPETGNAFSKNKFNFFYNLGAPFSKCKNYNDKKDH